MYGKIVLIQPAQNWTGAKLLSIPYYQTTYTDPKILQVIFLLLLL